MKYVFIGPRQKYMYVQYLGFKGKPDYELIMLGERHRRIAKFLNIVHISPTIMGVNHYYSKVIGEKLKERAWKDKICFILYSRVYESFGDSITKYLRKCFPDCFLAAYYGDMVAAHRIGVERFKKVFDILLTFDVKDADEYGLNWCLEPFSSDILKKKRYRNQKIVWDVTFVGKAKNRYKEIIGLYEYLSSNGFRCDFHITGVKKKDRLYENEISYEGLDFETLLEHVVKSHCIAEVLQDGAVSPTTRYSEALLFNRNIITDCKYFKKKGKRTDNVYYFEGLDTLENLDLSRIREHREGENAEVIEMFSIDSMINTILKYLEGEPKR